MPPSMFNAPPAVPSTNAPLLGLMRKFWPALLTTRTRSTVGLKSMPNVVPAPTPTGTGATPSEAMNVPVAPIGAEIPVVEEIE